MTGLFKQQLIAQRQAETDQYVQRVSKRLATGGINIAQEGILDSIKNLFADKQKDEKQMALLAKTGNELKGKVKALQGVLQDKKELPKEAQPINLMNSTSWFMVNGKVLKTEEYADAVRDIQKLMSAVVTSYIPALDANSKAVIQHYLTPVYQDKIETNLDLKKTINWKEPAEMYRLMTEKGERNKYLNLDTIESKPLPGQWRIQGIATPWPKYNIRLMHIQLDLPKPIKATIKCFTKDQCVEILGIMEEFFVEIDKALTSSGIFSDVENDIVKTLKKVEGFVPDEDDPNFKPICDILAIGYTVACRYEAAYDADRYAVTALRSIYKLCELSVNRMI